MDVVKVLSIPQILVVNHEPLLCYVMAAAMEDLGVKTTCVPNGTQAQAMVANQRFDMALINASSPEGPSGVELAKFIVNRNIAVLLLSGRPDVCAELKYAGYPYLKKPFTVGSLLDEMGWVLQDTQENIRRVKASAATERTNLDVLLADIAKTRRTWKAFCSTL